MRTVSGGFCHQSEVLISSDMAINIPHIKHTHQEEIDAFTKLTKIIHQFNLPINAIQIVIEYPHHFKYKDKCMYI